MDTQGRNIPVRAVILMLIFIVGIPLLPLLITRRWDWWEAWAFAAVSILGFAVSRLLAARAAPGLLGERTRFMQQEDTQPWDKVLAPLVGIGGGLIPLVAGVDALFGPFPVFSPAVKIAALIVILGGYALGAYALVVNRYFSGTVRLQTERGHQVISSGPYRWVRHPGYAGSLLVYLAAPLLLDSPWAFVPAVLLAAVLVVRTSLEDRFLQAELGNYRDYAGRVRYRLLPGVW